MVIHSQSTMVTPGQPQETMVNQGHQVNEGQPCSMKVNHAQLRSPMVDNVQTWSSMVTHGLPCLTIINQGQLWFAMFKNG
jgi:hypothetical protein